MGAADLAKQLYGPHAVASRSTWWQLKSIYEHAKGNGRDDPWFGPLPVVDPPRPAWEHRSVVVAGWCLRHKTYLSKGKTD